MRALCVLIAALAVTSCATPRGRGCLGFLERNCAERLQCVQYLERGGTEASCEIPCTSDAQCPSTDVCKLTREDQFGPINICVKKPRPE